MRQIYDNVCSTFAWYVIIVTKTYVFSILQTRRNKQVETCKSNWNILKITPINYQKTVIAIGICMSSAELPSHGKWQDNSPENHEAQLHDVVFCCSKSQPLWTIWQHNEKEILPSGSCAKSFFSSVHFCMTCVAISLLDGSSTACKYCETICRLVRFHR